MKEHERASHLTEVSSRPSAGHLEYHSCARFRGDGSPSSYELWGLVLNLIRAHFTASQIKLAAR